SREAVRLTVLNAVPDLVLILSPPDLLSKSRITLLSASSASRYGFIAALCASSFSLIRSRSFTYWSMRSSMVICLPFQDCRWHGCGSDIFLVAPMKLAAEPAAIGTDLGTYLLLFADSDFPGNVR